MKFYKTIAYIKQEINSSSFSNDEFYQVLKSLEDEKYKMVVSRQWQNDQGEAKREWYFRHDKIMDFFTKLYRSA